MKIFICFLLFALALAQQPGCRNIAFQVHDPAPSTTGILPFKSLHLNAGNGYDVNSGKFTAPVSGTYLFLVQLEVQKTSTPQHMYIEIIQSGSIIGSGYVETSSTIDDAMASASAITSMSKGEQVWIGFSGAFSLTSNVNLQNTHFSGALLGE